MNKQTNYAETLLLQMQEYVESWNAEAKRQEVSNVYTLEIKDGDKPLKSGGSVIKHYKTMELRVNTTDGDFTLYKSHAPLKNITEASRSKNWLLQLLRDLMYQMFTNYTIMVHASIVQKELSAKNVKKQIGSLVGLDGKPIVK